MDNFARRLEIMRILKRGRKVSVRELANRFEVSKTTIKHDLLILTPEIPFTVTYGRNGGFRYTGKPEVTLAAADAERLSGFLRMRAAETDSELRRIQKILETGSGKGEGSADASGQEGTAQVGVVIPEAGGKEDHSIRYQADGGKRVGRG